MFEGRGSLSELVKREVQLGSFSRLWLSSFGLRIEKNQRIVELLQDIRDKRQGLYDEYLRLRQQENKPGIYVWSEILQEMIKLRRLMAAELEQVIDKPPVNAIL